MHVLMVRQWLFLFEETQDVPANTYNANLHQLESDCCHMHVCVQTGWVQNYWSTN